MTADLHIHTNASDGTDTAIQVVEMAGETGIDIIAIADHESIDSVEQARRAGRQCGVMVVTGVELSARFRNSPIDVLGYGFDLGDSGLPEAISKNRECYIDIVLETIGKVSVDHVQVSRDDFEVYCGLEGHKSARFYKIYSYFRHKCPGIDTSEYFTWRNVYSVTEICGLILQAGGFPVLAHPGWSFRNYDVEQISDVLFELKDAGIAGVECFHPTHTPELANRLESWSLVNKMIITSGSDYHGELHNNNRIIGTPVEKLRIEPLISKHY